MILDRGNCILRFDNNVFHIEDEDKFLRCEAELNELMELNFSIEKFEKDLIFQTTSIDGFGTYLFYNLEFFKNNNSIVFVLRCHQPNKYWEGQWGLSTFLVTLADVIKDSEDFNVNMNSLEIEDDWKSLEITFEINSDFILKDIIEQYSKLLKKNIKRTELILTGIVWKVEYESNEKLFCTEIIFPLLRKMGFVDVRFSHGRKEYGKDFTFSELTKFGNLRHYALQVKAGNMRGNVNSDIDEIIGQLSDAFSMPYVDTSANEMRYVSTFIIAISGNYTENAKEKITQKIPRHFKGSIYFIDKDKILELIEKYWGLFKSIGDKIN